MFKSRSTMDRAFDAVLGHEIRKLNAHLPKNRKPLSELLKQEDPNLDAVDGSQLLLKSTELRELAEIVPTEYHDRVKLPFVILRRIEFGKSVYTVAGERFEQFTVMKILGVLDSGWGEMYKHREFPYLYRPQVGELLRRFHSLVVTGFGLPKELSDYAPNRA